MTPRTNDSAILQRDHRVTQLKVNPIFDSLRSDPASGVDQSVSTIHPQITQSYKSA